MIAPIAKTAVPIIGAARAAFAIVPLITPLIAVNKEDAAFSPANIPIILPMLSPALRASSPPTPAARLPIKVRAPYIPITEPAIDV